MEIWELVNKPNKKKNVRSKTLTDFNLKNPQAKVLPQKSDFKSIQQEKQHNNKAAYYYIPTIRNIWTYLNVKTADNSNPPLEYEMQPWTQLESV